MRIRSRNPKATIVGAVGTGLAGLWRGYSAVTTAKEVPKDLHSVSGLLADPGFWPWLFLVAFLLLLGWSLWPKPDEPEPVPHPTSPGPRTTGDHSPIFRDVHGNVTINPPPAPTQERKSPYGFARSPWDDPEFSLLNMGKKRPSGPRDVPLPEGIVWVLKRQWDGSFAEAVNTEMGPLGNAASAVRQAAADGEIRVWGKPSRTSVHVEIRPEFWIDHQPDWMSLITGESSTEPTEHHALHERYFDLMVSRADFTRKWRPRWTGGDDDNDPGYSWKTV